jgi:hypothetical protein
LVQDYINAGSTTANDRNAAMALRPMLESFARVVYPDLFPPGSLLGPFLQNCRQKLAAGTPGAFSIGYNRNASSCRLW